jgi:PAS domain S-box-containing protein
VTAPLRVLLVEDDPHDAELLLREMRRSGFEPICQRVETEADVLAALERDLDIVLSDFDLPQFDGLRALELVTSRRPEIPFIIVSGTIGEETAVAAMRRGAADYLLKDRLTRLGQAIATALAQARLRAEQRQLADELRRTESRYRSIFENAVEGIYQVSGDGRLLAANPALARILGYGSVDALLDDAIDLRELLVEAPDWRDELPRLLMLKGLVTGFEARVRRKDGAVIWVRLSVTASNDENGRTRYEGIVEDITERKHVEATRLRSQKLESLGTLSGGIAHDFNNILLAIDGHITLATDDLPPEHPVQENLVEIGRASARAADLVRQILTFGRPHDVGRVTIDLGPVVEEALRLVRATLPAMIEIRTSYDAELPAIEGDATQIHQIVVNLSTNAAHAIGSRGGVIDVALATVTVPDEESTLQAGLLPSRPPGVPPGLAAGDYVCLTVADNGSGMTSDTLERIFDPFYTTKAPGLGTGLGLSVVHGIVTSHGGAIAVDSHPSSGSTFRLYFPVAADLSRRAGAEERPAAPPGHGERVLYIDDEASLVSVATRVLSRLGYGVTGHTDVQRALADFRAHPHEFDVVVTDLSMPGMSGVELVTQLLATRPGTPILMTSGYAPPEAHDAALKLGIREFIPKPTLVTEIGHALGRVFNGTRQ